MIHVIAQHIGKGTYTPWYDILNFIEPVTFHKFDDDVDIDITF